MKILHDNGRTSRQVPSANITVSAETVGTTSAELVAEDASRISTLLKVVSGGPIYIDTAAATTAGGFPISTGDTFQYVGSAALNAIVASGTADVRVWDESE